jgi:Glycosyl transferase family 2
VVRGRWRRFNLDAALRKMGIIRLAPGLDGLSFPPSMRRQTYPCSRSALLWLWWGLSWEFVFVDDNSPDATSAVVKKLGQHDTRIRCIRRVGRRGLAGAFIERALSTQAQSWRSWMLICSTMRPCFRKCSTS